MYVAYTLFYPSLLKVCVYLALWVVTTLHRMAMALEFSGVSGNRCLLYHTFYVSLNKGLALLFYVFTMCLLDRCDALLSGCL